MFDQQTELATAEFLTLLGASKMPKFIGVRGYETKEGKVANYVVQVGADYRNKLAYDVELLTKYAHSMDVTLLDADDILAATELLNEYRERLNPTKENKRSTAQKDAYTVLNNAVKRHNENGKYYVYGFAIQSKTLVPAPAKEKPTKSNPVALAKSRLIKALKLKTSRYVSFIITQGDSFAVSGQRVTVTPQRVAALV
jgi:hypothetical protein